MLHWKGANDDDVEGILYYPDNYEAGKNYPLIVATHGGPAGADLDPMGRALGLRAESDDATRRVRAEDELSRQHRLRTEVGRIHLLRKILRRWKFRISSAAWTT